MIKFTYNYRSLCIAGLAISLLFGTVFPAAGRPVESGEDGLVPVSGKFVSRLSGIRETSENRQMYMKFGDGRVEMHLRDFSVFGYRGLGIDGTVLTDSNGRISGYENVRFTGFSGVKIKSVSGRAGRDHTEITLVAVFFLVAKVSVTFISY